MSIETRSDRVDSGSDTELEPGPYISLSVLDDGAGMSTEVRNRAFEPFFTTKDVGKGSGLGLSMVYGFVKQSGVHVEIDSDPGMGTCIRMLLPGMIESELMVPVTGVVTGVPRGNYEGILVVEDDQELRRIAFEILTDLDYRVLTAEDGPSALAIIAGEHRIDLLFIDMVLPHGMNGAELACQARVRRPDLKVVFTTGYPEEVLQRQGSIDPEHFLVGKPYRLSEVARTIRRALDNEQLSFSLEND